MDIASLCERYDVASYASQEHAVRVLRIIGGTERAEWSVGALFPDELALVGSKAGHTRLGFAVMLRFFAGEGRFPRDKHEVPVEVTRFVGEQVGEPAEGWLR